MPFREMWAFDHNSCELHFINQGKKQDFKCNIDIQQENNESKVLLSFGHGVQVSEMIYLVVPLLVTWIWYHLCNVSPGMTLHVLFFNVFFVGMYSFYCVIYLFLLVYGFNHDSPLSLNIMYIYFIP